MENGIYTRREIQVVLYESDCNAPFVIVNNDKCGQYPMVLTGENAERLILAIANCLDSVNEDEGS